MTDNIYTFPIGTAADWASENPVLAAGMPSWEVDTLQGKIGDGATPYNDLSYSLGLVGGLLSAIDDGTISGANVWSALQTSSAINEALVAANAYTDQSTAGFTEPYVPVDQSVDGSWPNRPAAYSVVARGYPGRSDPPSWLTTLIDEYKMRSA